MRFQLVLKVIWFYLSDKKSSCNECRLQISQARTLNSRAKIDEGFSQSNKAAVIDLH